ARAAPRLRQATSSLVAALLSPDAARLGAETLALAPLARRRGSVRRRLPSSLRSSVQTPPASALGAGGGQDGVRREAEQQAAEQAPGRDALRVEPAADGEQLDHHVEDGTRGQGEERDAQRLVGEPLADQGTQERR